MALFWTFSVSVISPFLYGYQTEWAWYYWGWFSQYLTCPHISSMPVNDCLTSQLQSHVKSIDCSLVCVHLVLVCWWWWFDWSFAHHVAAVVTTTSVTPIKCRMETFWYRLTQVYLENGHWNGERASGCVVRCGCEWSYTVCDDWSPVRFGFAKILMRMADWSEP